MTRLRKLSFILFLLSGSAALEAQDLSSDTITWKSVKAMNGDKNESFDLSCSFVTHGTGQIDWLQLDGAKVYHLVVVSTTGTWTDIKADGQMSYSITLGDLQGDITFSRSDGQSLVHLNIAPATDSAMNFTFYVSETD